MVPCKSTAKEVSLGWSQHRISFDRLKSLIKLQIDCGSERVGDLVLVKHDENLLHKMYGQSKQALDLTPCSYNRAIKKGLGLEFSPPIIPGHSNRKAKHS